MNATSLQQELIEQSLFRLNENTPKIEKCLNELTEDDIWKRPNNSSNSVGNIILHLCGNINQYIISSIGGKEDIRKRAEEFSTKGGYSKTELFNKLTITVNEAADIISKCNNVELLRLRIVQGFEKSGVGIIIQVVEHYSYHAGQIIFWTKLLKDKDMGFYKGMDLNKKNK